MPTAATSACPSDLHGRRAHFKASPARVHVDHHVLYVDPRTPSRVALGNDGGLNLSYDHGQTWTKINNLPVGQFTTLALDNAEPYNIVGGLQDNGVMRGPSTYVPGKSDPSAWKSIYGGDGSAV